MVTDRAFDEVIDLLTSCPSPETIIGFKPSAKMQHRASELLEKNRAGNLTTDGLQELEQFMLAEHLMRIAKARARKRFTE